MSSLCVDTSFGLRPRDVQLSNLKVNNISALNKTVSCQLDTNNALICKLEADVAIVNTLITNATTVEDGVFTINVCSPIQAWSVSGTIKKLDGVVYLNLIFTRNSPGILAPCNPIGTISAGFTPPFDISVAGSTLVGGVYSPNTVQISATGDVSAPFAGTTGVGDQINLVTSYFA